MKDKENLNLPHEDNSYFEGCFLHGFTPSYIMQGSIPPQKYYHKYLFLQNKTGPLRGNVSPPPAGNLGAHCRPQTPLGYFLNMERVGRGWIPHIC
jgi:hypothetical protein